MIGRVGKGKELKEVRDVLWEYGKRKHSTRKKSQCEVLRGMPGIWRGQCVWNKVGGGECLETWSKREQTPGHMGLVSQGKTQV